MPEHSGGWSPRGGENRIGKAYLPGPNNQLDDSGVRGCERANVLGYETDFIPCGITSPILRIYDIMPARCQVAVSWHVLKIEHLRGNDLKIEHLRGNDLKIELCQNCSKNRSEFYFWVKIDVVPFLGLI